ncbi:MAG: glycosyltransferase [Clostridia bacterium]|nr:glycosyltransferase [Clostridia bacterium]
MKLSYIIPVYNVEKYIRQCVDSILNQTMDDYEIILVDDGSPDNCPAICDEYKEKYPDKVVVIHKENEGPSVARNLGIDIAKGDYIFFADSDDYLVGDNIGLLYKVAIQADADVVHNSFFCAKDDEIPESICRSDFIRDKVYTHEEIEEIIGDMVYSEIQFMWRNLYKTDFLKKNGLKLDEYLKRVEDPPFNLWAFCLSEKMLVTDVPVYCYRLRNESLQRQKYVPDYDLWICYQWSLKIKYYEKSCIKNGNFYSEIARYTILSMLPLLLGNVYKNNINERRKVLKRLGNSEMMRRSFKDYDIKKFKSKSLDWWMTWCVKNRLYFIAHLICEKILYRKVL